MRTTYRVESFQRNRSKSACSGLSIVLAGLQKVQEKAARVGAVSGLGDEKANIPGFSYASGRRNFR